MFLDKLENTKKFCRFAWTTKSGSYHPNNDSFDGAIKMLTDSKADLLAKPAEYYIPERFVSFSNLLISLLFIPCQMVRRNANKNDDTMEDFIIYLIPSFKLFMLFFISFALYYSFLLISKKIKLRKSTLKVMTISFAVLFFLINEFFNSNLNTTNVVVSTSDLIASTDDVLATKR